MLKRRHYHHEETHDDSGATVDEQRPSRSISAHGDHSGDTAELSAGSNFEAETTTSKLEKSARSAPVQAYDFRQKSRFERTVKSDLSRRRKQFNFTRSSKIDHISKTTRGFYRLIRSHSEPFFLRKDSQKTDSNRRSNWRRSKLLSLRKRASEEYGHRLSDHDIANVAKLANGGSDGELCRKLLHRGILLWRSVRNFWHIGYFWIDFVHYQLETWRQLAGRISSAASHVRRFIPIVLQHQEDKMSTSNTRWPIQQHDYRNSERRQRPFISAANRSQSEAVHYYRNLPEVRRELDDRDLNLLHTNQYHLYLGESDEALRVNFRASMTSPQPGHYSNLIYGEQQEQLHHNHPQLIKMNTMDGSPVASSHRCRATLTSQRTMDSYCSLTPQKYDATKLLGDPISVTSMSGSQNAFYSPGLPLTTDTHIVDAADNFHHLYRDGSGRAHHDAQPRHCNYQSPPSARCYATCNPPVIAAHLGVTNDADKQPSTRQATTRPTNLSSSTNNPSCYSQSSLVQQRVRYAQRHRAANRQTAISSDSELHFHQRQSINLDGLANSHQVSANMGHQPWNLRNEWPGVRSVRPLYRQASATQASPFSNGQQHEFATDLTASGMIQQRNATINLRNSKKSPNLVRLSLEGAKKRLGFKQESGRLSQLSIQRSEEVLPFDSDLERLQDLIVNNSLADVSHSRTPDLDSSCCPSPFQWSWTGSGASRSPFIEGLGPGQVFSRQALVSPNIGDLMLTLCNRYGALEITVIKARRLQLKLGTSQKPSPYVKVYLIKDKKCIAKWKTLPAIQTLEPEYRQSFIYRGDFTNCAVQIIVWGDYGRKDRKSFMGIVQICTDDLELSSTITAWYKLFNTHSMINLFNSSKQMRQQMLPKRLVEAHSKSH